MKIDSLPLLIFLFWSLGYLSVFMLGQLYFSEEYRKHIIEILKKGNSLDKMNVFFFRPFAIGIRKASAAFGIFVILLFFAIIIVARLDINLQPGLLVSILLASLVLEIAATIKIISFKRKFKLDKEWKGGFRTFWAFNMASTPMICYKVMLGIYTFLYLLVIIKILMK